jgi:hypothetical protein
MCWRCSRPTGNTAGIPDARAQASERFLITGVLSRFIVTRFCGGPDGEKISLAFPPPAGILFRGNAPASVKKRRRTAGACKLRCNERKEHIRRLVRERMIEKAKSPRNPDLFNTSSIRKTLLTIRHFRHQA